MVAALLVVVVAGDVFMGSGRLPAKVSAPVLRQEPARQPELAATMQERIVLETVVVEAEVVAEKAVLERAAAFPEAAEAVDATAVEEPGDAVSKDASFEGAVEDVVAMPATAGAKEVAEAPVAEMEALAVTPEEKVLGMGGGGEPETAEPPAAVAPTMAAMKIHQKDEEPARPDVVAAVEVEMEPQPSAAPAPQATPEPMAVAIAPSPSPAPTEAVPEPEPTPAPQPTSEPQPAAELLYAPPRPPLFWTGARVAEFSLGGLFLVLLGLALWLRLRG